MITLGMCGVRRRTDAVLDTRVSCVRSRGNDRVRENKRGELAYYLQG